MTKQLAVACQRLLQTPIHKYVNLQISAPKTSNTTKLIVDIQKIITKIIKKIVGKKLITALSRLHGVLKHL